MKEYIFRTFFFLALGLGFANQHALVAAQHTYETYLESWDPKWEEVMKGLPPIPSSSPMSYNNVVLDIAFASYTFPGLNGLQFKNPGMDAQTVIDFVHAQSGKVKISYGGASFAGPNYFISKTPGWPNNMTNLVKGVKEVVETYKFDGVDFDIEDTLPSGTSTEDFANQLLQFLQGIRTALPGKMISLTIPAQGWRTYWQILAQKAAAAKAVDYINFMEYDIWIGTTYQAQIEADIVTYTSPTNASPAPNYSPGWGIPADVIQLGLMPGNDDTGKFLSLDDADALTRYVVAHGLVGVMTWDLNRDAGTVDPLNHYKYSNAIRGILDTVSYIESTFSSSSNEQNTVSNKQGRKLRPPFQRQPPPLHGAPD